MMAYKITPVLFTFLVGLGLLFSGKVDAQNLPQVYMPVYGNWCGPSHPVDISRAAPPLDRLDATCMRHDYCIAVRGKYDCGCDISFLQDLRSIGWSNPVIQGNARAIHDAIALVPCNSPEGTAYKQSLFAIDLLNDVAAGGGTPPDVLERWRRLFLKQLGPGVTQGD